MDKIWDRKSFKVGGHWPLWQGEKKRMTTQNRQKSNAKKTTPKPAPKENKMFDQTFIRFHYTPNLVYTGVMVISCSRRCWSLGWAVGKMLCLKLL